MPCCANFDEGLIFQGATRGRKACQQLEIGRMEEGDVEEVNNE
jgi:hypothetical protein